MNELEAAVADWIAVVGVAIDIAGVAIIVAGIGWASWRFLLWRMEDHPYECYKSRIDRSLLLGLEMLVAADIVKTIVIDATLAGLGVLAGLVAVRTFLSWTLVLEIDGRWPWRTQE
jgi:uncharacterized membrane protein